jgi:hypothetical protein
MYLSHCLSLALCLTACCRRSSGRGRLLWLRPLLLPACCLPPGRWPPRRRPVAACPLSCCLRSGARRLGLRSAVRASARRRLVARLSHSLSSEDRQTEGEEGKRPILFLNGLATGFSSSLLITDRWNTHVVMLDQEGTRQPNSELLVFNLRSPSGALLPSC